MPPYNYRTQKLIKVVVQEEKYGSSSHVQTKTIIKEKQIKEIAMRSYYLAKMKGVLKTNM